MVRLRGFPSATTARLEAEHEQALGAWHDAGAVGAPPYQPAERIFPEVSISDNVETAYAIRSSARGGSGTMFRADYVFVPGPQESTHMVVVSVGGADPVEVRLDT